MRALAWTLAAGMAFLAQRPSTARACSCLDPRPATSLLAPAADATDVPVNTRIWVGAKFGIDSFELRDASDAVVETALSTIEGSNARLHVLSPKAPLQPSSTYHVIVDGHLLEFFTTGTDRDDTAPAQPTVVSQTPVIDETESTCGATYSMRFELSQDGLLTVMVQEGGSFNTTALGGNPAHVSYEGTSQEEFDTRTPSIGRAGCSTNWADAKPGASTTVRFGSFDVAGNFSGFTDPVTVTIPASSSPSSSRESGCQSAEGAAALALLGLVARRRWK